MRNHASQWLIRAGQQFRPHRSIRSFYCFADYLAWADWRIRHIYAHCAPWQV